MFGKLKESIFGKDYPEESDEEINREMCDISQKELSNDFKVVLRGLTAEFFKASKKYKEQFPVKQRLKLICLTGRVVVTVPNA